MRCTACGAAHKIQDFAHQLDEDFDEEVGFVPMDRL
ncbi:dual CXXC motif small (seleno)protein [Humidesulfovibrio sp.]|nr:dual CXXC motif small (seleno)protein [Humidesulfovibrio sp.]